jgi:hypothetical protein
MKAPRIRLPSNRAARVGIIIFALLLILALQLQFMPIREPVIVQNRVVDIFLDLIAQAQEKAAILEKFVELRSVVCKGRAIGPYILLKSGEEHNDFSIVHEATHVDQCRRLGFLRYEVLQLYYTIRYGYFDNPLEVEARLAESSLFS